MATPFVTVRGPAAPLPFANIDTDVIIRIERLTAGDPARLGDYAFEALRYREDGSPNPEFPFNRPQWRDAPILLAGANFGCGSSREGAVQALAAMGVRCVVAESFGDIFYANCFQNGLLPIRLSATIVADAIRLAEDGAPFEVDLEGCVLVDPAGGRHPFPIDAMRREALLTGLDDIGLTLRDADAIGAWQVSDRIRRDWIWQPVAFEETRP